MALIKINDKIFVDPTQVAAVFEQPSTRRPEIHLKSGISLLVMDALTLDHIQQQINNAILEAERAKGFTNRV